MNFRKLCRIACVFFFLILFQGNSLAATIHGTVYEWNSFKPLNNAVVEINSTPVQSFVAKDAEYSFNLTPGTYLITANYFEEDKRIYTTGDAVVISDEGEYVHDLLLFPTYEEELLVSEEFEVPDMNFEETAAVAQKNNQNSFLVYGLLALMALLTVGYLLKKGHRKSPGTISSFPEKNGQAKALQVQSSVKDTELKEAEFSDNINVYSIENPVETTDRSPDLSIIDSNSKLPITGHELSLTGQDLSMTGPEFSVTNPESLLISPELSADITEKISTTEKIDYPVDKDKLVRQTKHQDPERWHFPFSSRNHKSDSDFHKNSKINLPEDLKELLELIRSSGNRITQREIRKKSPYSESKVSLMLSDLEQRGLIEKFKRGRGNIIRIPDRHIHKQAEHESKKE